MKLISEIYQEPLSILSESKDGKKNMYIQGIFAQSEVKNRNGRMYPKSVMESAIEKYNVDKIQRRTALGEMNHPPRLNVDFERATHMITEMRWDGNDVIGKAKVLHTSMGKLLEGLLESGVNIGVSTRGAGTIKESNGINMVGNDFLMTAVDVVSDPSGPDCWVNGIMEGVEFVMDENGRMIQHDTKEELVEMYNKKKLDEEAKLAAFNKFVNRLKG